MSVDTDQYGQVIDVLTSRKRDLAATRRFFAQALGQAARPSEVTTDRAPTYSRMLDELLPAAHHVTEQYANTESRPTTVRLNLGYARCADSHGFTRRG
jgi:transposase-like protein